MIRTVRLCVNRAREAFRALLLELLGKHYEYRFVDKVSFLKALIHFNDEICDSPHSTPLLQKKRRKKEKKKLAGVRACNIVLICNNVNSHTSI